MHGSHKHGSGFRQFFLRGLGIVLPTVLTIWILTFAYRFLSQNIAEPINQGLRWAVVQTGWPLPEAKDYAAAEDGLTSAKRAEWGELVKQHRQRHGNAWSQALQDQYYQEFLAPYARRAALERHWVSIRIGTWVVLDLLGLILAIIAIYLLGRLLGGYIGGQFVRRGEMLINRVPLIRNVYPAVKQVTEFIFPAEKLDKAAFSRVVAVQYPRQGIWSLGLMTGDTMSAIQNAAGADCVTIFIPSSPTPFTGYVITVPREDTIDIPVSIEDAIKFVVSLGVVIPPAQKIVTPGGPGAAAALPPAAMTPTAPSPASP